MGEKFLNSDQLLNKVFDPNADALRVGGNFTFQPIPELPRTNITISYNANGDTNAIMFFEDADHTILIAISTFVYDNQNRLVSISTRLETSEDGSSG